MATKLLLDSLRLADGGKVVCEVTSADGTCLPSVIEQSFFAEFGNPTSTSRQLRIVQENVDYLEAEAQRQLTMGHKEIVIR